jgi:hypothetical protein
VSERYKSGIIPDLSPTALYELASPKTPEEARGLAIDLQSQTE